MPQFLQAALSWVKIHIANGWNIGQPRDQGRRQKIMAFAKRKGEAGEAGTLKICSAV